MIVVVIGRRGLRRGKRGAEQTKPTCTLAATRANMVTVLNAYAQIIRQREYQRSNPETRCKKIVTNTGAKAWPTVHTYRITCQ
jgi:hypothetical protein